MRKAVVVAVLVAGIVALAVGQEKRDPRAVAIADQVMEAMGGRAAWENVRYLRFDFAVEGRGAPIPHLWDRHQGRYRVEWQNREGNRVQVLFNVNTREGEVWIDGKSVTDAAAKKQNLERGYGRFINDTYWLLMPLKLKDPGVNLEYAGKTQLEGETYDLLHLSFNNVGLTPGDHYWAFINQKTHLMDRWAYFLQRYEGTPSLEKATAWNWEQWENFAGVRLAREKVNPERNAKIHFPVLAVLADVDEQVFASPDVPLPGEPQR